MFFRFCRIFAYAAKFIKMFGPVILRVDKKSQNTSVYICITFNYLIFARKMKCQTVEKHVENVNNFFTKVRKMSYLRLNKILNSGNIEHFRDVFSEKKNFGV